MSREFYLEEHDPQRWLADNVKKGPGYAPSDAD
jgi:hypothetical protein